MHTGQLIDSTDTDGLGAALRRQSCRLGHDMAQREFAREFPEPKDWDKLRGFERGQHSVRVSDGMYLLVREADCRQIKAAP